MNATPTSFQSVLDALLSDRKEFPRRYLQEFSDIGTLELKTLLDVWPQVKPSRKLTLLEELDALAETDTLVSFDDVARALLTLPPPDARRKKRLRRGPQMRKVVLWIAVTPLSSSA